MFTGLGSFFFSYRIFKKCCMKSVVAPEETVKNLPDDQTLPAGTRFLTNKRNSVCVGGVLQ